MTTITKTLAAGALALTVTASGANASVAPDPNADSGLVISALFLGLVGLLIATGGGGTTTTSTKDGPALDLDLPDPGTQTIKDF